MCQIKDNIDFIITEWNKANLQKGINSEYEFKISIRNKDFYINKKEFETTKIAEASLFQRGDKELLLWRKEFEVPKKIKSISKIELENDIMKNLSRSFLYECIGSFCIMTNKLILNQDYAEYDIAKDRLKQHPGCKEMVVTTIQDGEFYKKGDSFDVFMELDKDYAIYSCVFKKNNGIGKIPKSDVMISQLAKPKIELIL